jgi:hypothetical protein
MSRSLSTAIHGSTLAAAMLASASAYAGSGAPTFQDFVNAYVWAYPLATVEGTMLLATAVPNATTASLSAPRNQFYYATTLQNASETQIVRPNADTLYASAWLDLKRQPVIITVPATDRFYVMPILDAYTNSITPTSIGSANNGGAAGAYAIVGPDWTGPLPSGLTAVLHSPTNNAWVIGRTFVNGPSDLAAAVALEEQYKITPLAYWGLNYTPPKQVRVKAPPAAFTSGSPIPDSPGFFTGAFYKFALQGTGINPAPSDAANIAALATLHRVNAHATEFTTSVVQAALQQMAATELPNAARNDGWLVLQNTGLYGDNFAYRALATYIGFGVPLPQDAVYPQATTDDTGTPLSCANTYTIHFNQVNGVAQTPPNNGFWSVTAYNSAGLFIANPINRYNVGGATGLTPNADGSIDIVLQSTQPTTVPVSNWLPCGTAAFNLSLRVYAPAASVLNNTYAMPLIAMQPGPL